MVYYTHVRGSKQGSWLSVSCPPNDPVNWPRYVVLAFKAEQTKAIINTDCIVSHQVNGNLALVTRQKRIARDVARGRKKHQETVTRG